MRLFYAIPVEDPLRGELAKFSKELRERLPAGSWIDPDQFHLTVRFLGEVSEEKLEEAIRAGEQAAAASPPEALQLEAKPGHFRNRGGLVFWAGLRPDPWLTGLAEQLNRTIAGIPPEKRPFSPHLTLGRLRGRKIRKMPGDFLPWFESERLDDSLVQEKSRLVLYQSELAPDGAVHTELRSWPS